MSVAFDNSSESHTGTTGSTSASSFNWSHISIGTPRGFLVFTCTNANADDATAVDIGGVSLTAVTGGRAVDTAGEAGDVKAWFLGSSVPTGTQTVTVTRNNNANEMWAIGISFTASGDTEVYEPGIVLLQGDGTIAEQNVDDGSPGTDSTRFAVINSGLPTVPSAGANSTASRGIDFGARVIQAVRETVTGQGSRPIGFSSGTSDDRAAVHLAVRQVASGAATTVGWAGAGYW